LKERPKAAKRDTIERYIAKIFGVNISLDNSFLDLFERIRLREIIKIFLSGNEWDIDLQDICHIE
jgi:hypothetical protein